MSVLSKIKKFNKGRSADLLKVKFTRMSESPFTFFRGTNHLFIDAWSKLSPPDPGPPILICGDLHVENFGAFRTETGDWCFGINDFDDADIAPCGLDVVRCASSILLAATDWKLSPIAAASLVLVFLDEYRSTLLESDDAKKSDRVESRVGRDAISRALCSTKLATRERLISSLTNQKRNRIKSDTRKRPLLSKRRSSAIVNEVQGYLETKSHFDGYRALDITGRIAGIGSLGNERYLALIENDAKNDERLFDVKLAVRSPISTFSDVSKPSFYAIEAERTVIAQRTLQGATATGLDFATFQTKSFRIREMVPDEDRCQIDRFRKKTAKLKDALEVMGHVVALSHLRGTEYGTPQSRQLLVGWASGANLDAILKSSVRCAQRTTEEFSSFKDTFRRKHRSK